ncbi:hypothetical protein F4561_004699 [Lipingzhangella halophila]|uniref:DUF4350 domain-containing protein n=1 Tax=Lipingzhangella halophila TaxID=1783352 RepID=A0A7W7RKW9_9ACTN|nr:DUF4350 domain-containing protein [Lipingzhangella halophila]MBB4933879.1 hypothetical protein [Lipingzhangella halophila]
MTTTAPPPTRTGPSGPSPVTPGPGDLWRRVRGPLAFLGGLVVVAVVLSLGAEQTNEGLLDPEGANPQGTRALVQILQERGADVTIARNTEDARTAGSDDDTVVVLAQSHRLLPEELDQLAATRGDLVLIQPTTQALNALAPGVRVADRTDDPGATLSPQCDLPGARAAGDAETGGELYTASEDAGAGGSAPVSCYPSGDGAALVQVPRGDGGTTTVLGTGVPLTNERLATEGNAALGLNLVGEHDAVWFLPDVPTQAEQAQLWELIPRAFYLALAPLGATLLLLALWRGRRLGPLVTERLPVVVRSSETTEGRARLYASRRARDRAAVALRSGVIERVRPALGLGPDASPESVVTGVAERTGDNPARLRELLYGDAAEEGADVPDDAALVRLADDLDALEDRLR